VFLFNFKKEAMFQDNFDEFDDSKEVVENLISEYKATENANYLQNLDESQN
jgi:tubulin gamma